MVRIGAATDGTEAPWRRGLLWLLFLGPFFFLSYGLANGLAARRAVTDAIVFGWEPHIPFLPWTIVPYWSIDLFYALALPLGRSRAEIDRLGRRLLTAQLVSVACFLLFPLRFSFERPVADGVSGAMFALLASFDQPYNQAPSLHISLLVILWAHYAPRCRAAWTRLALHLWFVLIGVSVLTTYQHHFIDVPTGLAVGLLCLWLWPDAGRAPLSAWRLARSPQRRRLALIYAAAAGLLALMALWRGGAALWLLWGTVSLALVALCYAGLGPEGFQKRDGRHSQAVALLAAPYLLGAWLNSRWWTRRRPQADAIAEDVWLGRMPSPADMTRGRFAALLDLTAELPAPRGPWRTDALPLLDLVPPEPGELQEAARRLEALRLHARGPLLVCCALGYSRGASVAAAWLLHTGRAASVQEALERVQARRPGVVLGARHRAALAAGFADSRQEAHHA